MGYSLGQHLRKDGIDGIVVNNDQIIFAKDHYMRRENLNSPFWQKAEIVACGMAMYATAAEEIYENSFGKHCIGPLFITDVKNLAHQKNQIYQIANVATLGVGTSVASAYLESCEQMDDFVNRGDNNFTKAARVAVALPVIYASTVVKTPVYLASKLFSWFK